MNKELKAKIEKVFLQENLCDCKLKFDSIGLCCYILEENTVNMDLEALKKQYLDFLNEGILNCSFDDYAVIILLHEIGHAKDAELKKSKVEKRRIRKQMIYSKSESEFNSQLDKYMKCTLTVERKAWNYVIEKKFN